MVGCYLAPAASAVEPDALSDGGHDGANSSIDDARTAQGLLDRREALRSFRRGSRDERLGQGHGAMRLIRVWSPAAQQRAPWDSRCMVEGC